MEHQCIVHEKANNLSVWIKEICTLLVILVWLDLFNDDTCPSGHISCPAHVNVSQSCFHSLLVKLHIICSSMQRVNLHARPSVIQVGYPTMLSGVCTGPCKGGTADLDYPSKPCHHNVIHILLISFQVQHQLTIHFIPFKRRISIDTREGSSHTSGMYD